MSKKIRKKPPHGYDGEVPSAEMDLLVQIECLRRLNAKIGAHPWRYALNR
jgi:hypothetical protein